jgi:hypothetical protein
VGVTERIWNALTAMIKLEDKVGRQSDAIKSQQAKIENLTERVIRLETALEIGLAQARSTRPVARQPLPHAHTTTTTSKQSEKISKK